MVAINRQGQGRWLSQDNSPAEDRSNRGPLKFHTKVPLMSVATFREILFFTFRMVASFQLCEMEGRITIKHCNSASIDIAHPKQN